VGLGFGLADVRPIPAILLAQALNGLLLPLVSVFLLIAVNDRRLMGSDGVNGALANLLLAAVVAVTFLLGFSGIARAVTAALGIPPPGEGLLLVGASGMATLAALPLWRAVRRCRMDDEA
jgi:hypothetical protein